MRFGFRYFGVEDSTVANQSPSIASKHAPPLDASATTIALTFSVHISHLYIYTNEKECQRNAACFFGTMSAASVIVEAREEGEEHDASSSVTMSSASSSLVSAPSSSLSRRYLAKQKIQQTWANRRLSIDVANSNKKKKEPSLALKNPETMCSLFRGAWFQTTRYLQKQTVVPSSGRTSPPFQKSDVVVTPSVSSASLADSTNDSTATTTTSNSSVRKKTKNGFPSVYQLMQTVAVSRQMESFGHDEEKLTILPTSYNWKRAVQSLSEGRHRAFVLLDLAAMVQSHFALQQAYPNVAWQFRVDHNRNGKVLELWTRLGVGLRCNNKYDLVQTDKATTTPLQQQQEDEEGTPPQREQRAAVVLDDPGRTRKPDGYLQRIYQHHGVRTFVVDGPEEVERIHTTLSRKLRLKQRRRRRRTRQEDEEPARTGLPKLQFLLRLEQTNPSWRDLAVATRTAAEGVGHELVGISVPLLEKSNEIDDLDCKLQSMRSVFDQQERIRLDLTGLPTSWFNAAQSEFLQRLSTTTAGWAVSADASRLLIDGAGALCTRIIGVKKKHEEEEGEEGEGKNDESSGGAGGGTNYYIDDGCYGSLCQQHASPLPLHPTTGNAVDCTVWGPTCDGLDKVCETTLPPLQQNEWLVFPEMGSVGGLGTSFNGFEPPDTAYCVLGYFRPQQYAQPR